MKPEWKEFLVEQGANFEKGLNEDAQGEELLSFGNPEQERQDLTQGTVLFDLSSRGLIKVHGEDAETFLQNQLTNDIRNVNETTHQASAWCSPKGRIIASFRIFNCDNAYYLSLSSDLIELVLKRLRMYVMMSKVTLEDVSDSMVHFGFAGDGSEKALQQIIADIPSSTEQSVQYKSLSVLRLPGTVSRFEIFGELDDAKGLWEQCSTNASLVNSDEWQYLNILAGLPLITEASSEVWIPQMVNYIAVDGVDFKKGCYPGQEVVARLNYLGKTKRRMYLIEANTNNLPYTGNAISSDSDKEAGKILNAVINPAGNVSALAVIKIAEANNSLSMANDNEASITLHNLPYPMDDD